MSPAPVALHLSPAGHLVLADDPEAAPLEASLSERLHTAFGRGQGPGLLHLGGSEVRTTLPPPLAWWRSFAARLVTAHCTRPETTAALQPVPPPPDAELEGLALAPPPMTGAEYLSVDVLGSLWTEMDEAFTRGHAAHGGSVQDYLTSLDPGWNVVGRVHFNLAENRRDEAAPFAFLATYADSLSHLGTARHQPLGQALREYAGAANKERLLSLLMPVQRAAETCSWLRAMVDSGEVFHPLRWSPAEALRFLGDVALLEKAGVVARLPASWKAGRPPRPTVTVTVGGSIPSKLSAGALLDVGVRLTLDGEPLSPDEMAAILAGTAGLALVRGRWVEVDPACLDRTLERFRRAESLAAAGGLTFAEAMRLLAGVDGDEEKTSSTADASWHEVTAGPWLAEVLRGLRSPEGLSHLEPGPDLRGTLRPYQQTGLQWLGLLSQLGLGACLADDMGLGKTVQVIALLLADRRKAASDRRPSLLVAPASLLANWAAELARFAPSLSFLVAHPSAMPAADLKKLAPENLGSRDLVITSYGSLLRIPWLATTPWHLLVLDEAQAIKNPQARQTKAAKKLDARARIALTGTPVENRLGDLWSIFDVLNPGLLGSAKDFTTYTKSLASRPGNPYAPLRELVRPYILRRLKSDRSVIADLPEKTETKAWCHLSRLQEALYRTAVEELAARIEEKSPGIERRGLILSFLMRLKQICNHPSQWLGDGAWAAPDSGKFARLSEICDVVAARQEKMLVFTQFRETTAPLASFLGDAFGRPGLVLHGETPVKERRSLVDRFQDDEAVPFFVLSLKAGGSGLNLTAASHVVHFDRWWNPAVENQATDRAFRIGQKRNVLVHKFICRGTVEEKIDALIDSKKKLSEELLEGGADLNLTELPDDELLRLVRLDISAAMME